MSFKKDQLRYFVTVAEEGQMTRAARRLLIAQPALSQAISQLETELGFRLLERHPRGVTLTSAGSTFLSKARVVVASERNVRRTGEALARAASGVLAVGFIGPPPTITLPELFTRLSANHPEAEVTFRDMPFPSGPTDQWLNEVDIAVCHAPAANDNMVIEPLRTLRRFLILRNDHPLANREEVDVAAVIDECFISYAAQVQPEWAGFHSLDDHRGGPPLSSTADNVASALQMLGLLGTTAAVTTLPEPDARIVAGVLSSVAVVPLRDAEPAVISLAWHADSVHPLIGALVETARGLSGQGLGVG